MGTLGDAALDMIIMFQVAQLGALTESVNRGMLDECSPEVLTALENGVRDLLTAATARRTFIFVQPSDASTAP